MHDMAPLSNQQLYHIYTHPMHGISKWVALQMRLNLNFNPLSASATRVRCPDT